MSLSQILKKELNDKGVGDIIKAFRLAIQLEQQELSAQQRLMLQSAPMTPAWERAERKIHETKLEIASLKFTFRQLTGLQFGIDLEIQ